MVVNRDRVKRDLINQIFNDCQSGNQELLNKIISDLSDDEMWEFLSNENKDIIYDDIDDETTIPITFYQIKTVGWSRYCDVTGGNHYAINEGYDPDDREIFNIKKKHAKELGFI